MKEDILKLTEKPVRRIYKLDIDELNEKIRGIEKEIKDTRNNLANLVDFAVAYFENLKKKYGGTERKRKTKSVRFDEIVAAQVARANRRLYVNRREGFVGYGFGQGSFGVGGGLVAGDGVGAEAVIGFAVFVRHHYGLTGESVAETV